MVIRGDNNSLCFIGFASGEHVVMFMHLAHICEVVDGFPTKLDHSYTQTVLQ